MNGHCCEMMTICAEKTCDMHERFECPDCLIHHRSDGQYGIFIKDGGTSMIIINFCPWCGTELPQEGAA